MKWFKLHVNSNGIFNSNIEIKNKITNEYGLPVEELSHTDKSYRFSIASNHTSNCSYFAEEQLLILGDISIHNQAELISKYDLKNELDSNFPIEFLIRLLYKAKGVYFVKDIVGEFSFVIYDEKKSKTYLIRDQLGVKTLFWYKNDFEYIISSDIFLLKDEMVFNKINNNYFKEYYLNNGIVDSESTPFIGVNRVSSGSFVEIGRDELERQSKYWDLTLVNKAIYHRDDFSYIEEFRNLLYISVKDRLTQKHKNSVMLSGGLDSTSIYAIIKSDEYNNEKYRTESVSAIFNELKECDESYYINGLLEKYKEKGILVNCDNVLLFKNFPNNAPFSYEPNVNALSFDFTYTTIKTSVDHGLTNILSGYGGDQLLTGSMYFTRDLIGKFKIKEALTYITDYSITTNTSALKNLKEYVIYPDIISKYNLDKDDSSNELLIRKLKKIKSYHQKELYYQLNSTKSHIYTDRVIGALTGADISHPFLDRRLIEYVYSIPGEFRRSNGLGKFILRESMKDHLTEEIVKRVNKTTHVAHIYKSIRENWNSIFNSLNNPIAISNLGLTTVDDWRNQLLKWRNGVSVSDDFWALIAIELWFNSYYQKELV